MQCIQKEYLEEMFTIDGVIPNIIDIEYSRYPS